MKEVTKLQDSDSRHSKDSGHSGEEEAAVSPGDGTAADIPEDCGDCADCADSDSAEDSHESSRHAGFDNCGDSDDLDDDRGCCAGHTSVSSND